MNFSKQLEAHQCLRAPQLTLKLTIPRVSGRLSSILLTVFIAITNLELFFLRFIYQSKSAQLSLHPPLLRHSHQWERGSLHARSLCNTLWDTLNLESMTIFYPYDCRQFLHTLSLRYFKISKWPGLRDSWI